MRQSCTDQEMETCCLIIMATQIYKSVLNKPNNHDTPLKLSLKAAALFGGSVAERPVRQ